MAKLRERLIELRTKFQMTQGQVAELSGISQTQISRYERGDGDITGENLLSLSKLFGVTTDYLLGKSNETPYDELAPKERLALASWRRGERFEAIKVIVDDE